MSITMSGKRKIFQLDKGLKNVGSQKSIFEVNLVAYLGVLVIARL